MKRVREREESPDEDKAKVVKINHYSSQGEDPVSDSKPNSPENKNNESDKKDTDNTTGEASNFSSLVATHYNAVQTGFDARNNSRIYYLRNFNNWIKSILIRESVHSMQDQNQRNLIVLDMCCGKGGDLFKWAKLNVRYMVCTDIADVSIEQYKSRYKAYMEKCQRNDNKDCKFDCEFIPADCTRVHLRGKYHDPSIQFNIVSCQFSFHYCFESLPQAECMLKNATDCLKPGGLFIGTIPNANEIVKRLKQSGTTSIKNEIFSIEMCCSEPYPLFGAKYNFYLEGVVNCPEFLVHFPTFEKLALKYGLQLVKKEKFNDFFERNRKVGYGDNLLRKIKALEIFSTDEDRKLIGPYKDYQHARVFCDDKGVKQVGTLSKSEWDVASLYLTFVFKKV